MTNLLCRTAIRKWIAISQFRFQRLDRMNISTSCTILVTFGPDTSEFTLLQLHLLWWYGKNRHITPNISECPRPTLNYFTGLIDVLVRMIFQVFVWRSPKGRCYDNQSNMGDICKHCMEGIYSLLRHSTTDWPIVKPLSKASMAIIRLQRVQIL